MENKKTIDLLKQYDFRQDGKRVVAHRKKPICGICKNWEDGKCLSDERHQHRMNEALEMYGTTDGVLHAKCTGYYTQACVFFQRTNPRRVKR